MTHDGNVFHTAMDVNSDVPITGHDIALGDPRKLSGNDNTPITNWQLATHQTHYDPYQNPWMV